MLGVCPYIRKKTMINVKDNKIFEGISKALSSFYFNPILLALGFLCWILELPSVVVPLFAFAFILVLLFCKDVKNIFTPLFFVAFFIPDILAMTDYTIYYIGAGGAIVSLLVFVVYKLITDRKNIKGGKFALGLIASFIAYLLSGVIGNFNIVHSGMILGFCLAIYIFYIIAINYTENLKEHFEKLFIIAAIIIGYQIAQTNLPNRPTNFFSAIGLNTAVLFVTIGIIACFTKSLESKRDYLYFALVIVLTICVVLSRCRMGMLLTAIIDIVFTIILLTKSQNKKIIIALLALAMIALTLGAIFLEPIKQLIIKVFTAKQGLSGREVLWEFCIERFLEHPALGYGFFYDSIIPSLRGDLSLILAHNTFLQWIACSGVIGSLIMVVFYVNKYNLLCKNFNKQRVFVFTSVIMVELSGMMDQAATMDPFLPIIVIILMACIEKEKPILPLAKEPVNTQVAQTSEELAEANQ